ncbi:hypothetical protein VUR80DRAFT_8069 [Thermomyces stellatus]
MSTLPETWNLRRPEFVEAMEASKPFAPVLLVTRNRVDVLSLPENVGRHGSSSQNSWQLGRSASAIFGNREIENTLLNLSNSKFRSSRNPISIPMENRAFAFYCCVLGGGGGVTGLLTVLQWAEIHPIGHRLGPSALEFHPSLPLTHEDQGAQTSRRRPLAELEQNPTKDLAARSHFRAYLAAHITTLQQDLPYTPAQQRHPN